MSQEDDPTVEVVLDPGLFRRQAEKLRERAYEILHFARDLESMAEFIENSENLLTERGQKEK